MDQGYNNRGLTGIIATDHVVLLFKIVKKIVPISILLILFVADLILAEVKMLAN